MTNKEKSQEIVGGNIDLGLSSGTLWAKYNVGAESEEECGDYLTFDESQKYNCPSKEQIDELIIECIWEWKGNGYNVKGRNGNSIFLPAAGHRRSGKLNDADSHGDYWSSSLFMSNPNYAYEMYFHSGKILRGFYYRPYGLSVREVKLKPYRI